MGVPDDIADALTDPSKSRVLLKCIVEYLEPSFVAASTVDPELFPRGRFNELRRQLSEDDGQHAASVVAATRQLPCLALPEEPAGISAFGVDAAAALFYSARFLADQDLNDALRAIRRAQDAAEFASELASDPAIADREERRQHDLLRVIDAEDSNVEALLDQARRDGEALVAGVVSGDASQQ